MALGSETYIHVYFDEDWSYGDNDAVGRGFSAHAFYTDKAVEFEGRLALGISADTKEAIITLTKPAVEEPIKSVVRESAVFVDQIIEPNWDVAELAGKMLLTRFPISYQYDQVAERAKK